MDPDADLELDRALAAFRAFLVRAFAVLWDISVKATMLAAQVIRAVWMALAAFERRLERRVDKFVTTGWRKYFGWLALAVAGFSYIYAPLHSIAVDYVHVDIFLSFATGMYIARGVEKHVRDKLEASDVGVGALVNNNSLS